MPLPEGGPVGVHSFMKIEGGDYKSDGLASGKRDAEMVHHFDDIKYKIN